ncbi:hypothetical protein A4X13_0g4541 [Tilletia indica]|uniref:Uncharacterized protein n=1 Tax=Tilletia indica TaxID=43049 RepID=A0A177TCA8_9BASI|nr:hypothetical protein A4X13_0g4541 [Tilletia indica]
MSRPGPHATALHHHPHQHHPAALHSAASTAPNKTAAVSAANMAHTHGGTAASRSASSNNGGVGNSAGHSSGGGRRKQNASQSQNLNHLLSFTLPPRAPPPPAYARRSTRRAGGSGGGSSWQAYDKERYVNGQYRFLVKPTEDYTAHFADPDIYLPWSHIVQVLIPTSSALSSATTGLLPSQAADSADAGSATCPICLSPPSAPRITRCGHVFCYPCILHYLATSADASDGAAIRSSASLASSSSTSGVSTPSRAAAFVPGAARIPSFSSQVSLAHSNSGVNTPTRAHPPPASAEATTATSLLPRLQKFSRCPICGDPVYARDLKAVKWWDARGAERKFTQGIQSDVSSSTSMPATSGNGEYLTLRLIERPHLTTLALPQSPTWPPKSFNAGQSSTSDRHASFLDPEIKHALDLDSPPSLLPVDAKRVHANKPTSTNLGGPISPDAAPWHFLPDVMTYAKLMLASPAYLLSSLAEDLSELAVERALLDGTQPGSGGIVDELGLVFVEMAERKVEEQMEKVRIELDTQWVRRRINAARAELVEHEEKSREDQEKEKERAEKTRLSRVKKGASRPEGALTNTAGDGGVSTSTGSPDEVNPAVGHFLATRPTDPFFTPSTLADDEAVGEEDSAPRNTGRGQRTRRNINPPAPLSSSSLFYQAASGQNIFLHPLDIKILRSQYNSYALFPRHLRVRVGGADESSVNAELRRRCKYLNHLPMSADVVFIEIDWEGMVAEAEVEARARHSSSQSGAEEEQDLEATVEALPRLPISEPKESSSFGPDTAITSSGLPIIQRATLKPYEQALRQRRQRRTDKARKEDRAKTRAEEADRVASAAALSNLNVAHHGVVNGGRRVQGHDMGASSGHSRHGGMSSRGRSDYDSSSIGGGTTQSDDQFGRSFNSNSEHGGGPGSFGSGAAFANFTGSTSPSFRDAAMVGAERVFPVHPGHEAETEEFPDILGGSSQRDHTLAGPDEEHADYSSDEAAAANGSEHGTRPNLGGRKRTPVPGPATNTARRTVWGTPAAARPWTTASTTTNGNARQDADDYGWSEMDDAWMELEEEYILGAGNHGQRRMGGMTSLLNKESRGMNAQTAASGSAAGGPGSTMATPTSATAKNRAKPSVSARGSSSSSSTAAIGSATPAQASKTKDQVEQREHPVEADAETEAAAAGGRKQKAKKKKLILTAGGRGGR